jgi:flavodoxin
LSNEDGIFWHSLIISLGFLELQEAFCYEYSTVVAKLEVIRPINGHQVFKESKMRVLNLYYSSTGNTAMVADRIDKTVKNTGYIIDSVRINKETGVDVLLYDLVFAGSGVYGWLPGKPVQKLFERLRSTYAKNGAIKPASPKLPGKHAVIYCTYGGVHTGINEAIPAVKYMGQLFDHLGFYILAEWYLVGAYRSEKLKTMSYNGRLGDISDRPNEHDLKKIEEAVKGIMRS